MNKFALLLPFFILFCNNLYCQTSADLVFLQNALIPLDSKLKIGRLSNGFTYFIRPNNNPSDKVYLKLLVRAGTMCEDKDQLGLAHLLEHMAFVETKHFRGSSLKGYLGKMGLRPGTDWNGSTGFTHTEYWMNIPADDPGLLKMSLQILRDWAQGIVLDSTAIERERKVVLEESRQSHSYVNSMNEQMEFELLKHPNYPDNWRERHDMNIKKFMHSSLRRFYGEWYRPDLQAVCIVGNINPDEVEGTIKTLFSDLTVPLKQNDYSEYIRAYKVENSQHRRVIFVTNDEMPNIVLKVFQTWYGKVEGAIRTVGDYRNSILCELYNEMISNRLQSLKMTYKSPFENAVSKIEKGAINPKAQINALTTTISLSKSQSIKSAFKAVFTELERVAQHGFSNHELSLAKEQISVNRRSKQSFKSDHLLRNISEMFVNSVIASSPEVEHELTNRILREITVHDVNNMAVDWIRSESVDIAILAPALSLPSQREVFRWLKDIKSAKLEDYHASTIQADSIICDVELPQSINTIVEQFNVPELGVNGFHLSNGIRFILKPLKTSKQATSKIYFAGLGPSEIANYSDADTFSALYATEIIQHSGVGSLKKFKLDFVLKNKNILLDLGLDKAAASINGSCNNDDLEQFLQLLYLTLTSPRIDKIALDDWISLQKEIIANPRPETRFFTEINKVLDSSDIKSSTGTITGLTEIDLKKVEAIYRRHFSSPTNFTFVLAGDFRNADVIALLCKYFGAFSATPPVGRNFSYRSPIRRDSVSQFHRKVIYAGKGNSAQTELYFIGNHHDFSYRNEILIELMRRVLMIRMTERLREKEGGVYYVNTTLGSMGFGSDVYSFNISFRSAVENVDYLIACVIEEFNDLKENGVDEPVFARAKSQEKSGLQKDLASSRFWANYLCDKYYRAEKPTDILMKSTILDLLTNDELNQAFSTYLADGNFFQFVLLPVLDGK